MTNPFLRRTLLGFCLAPVSLAFLAAPAQAEPGEKWKIISSMSMAGMTMPARTDVVCAAKGSTEAPPTQQQKNCSITGMKHSGTKDTAHIHCSMNGQTMDGDLENERLGPDHFRSVMHMKSAQGTMDMMNESQKIPGACDTAENGKAALQRGKDRMKSLLGH